MMKVEQPILIVKTCTNSGSQTSNLLTPTPLSERRQQQKTSAIKTENHHEFNRL